MTGDSSNSRLTADSNYTGTGSLRQKIFHYIRQFTQAQARHQVHQLYTSNELTTVKYPQQRRLADVVQILYKYFAFARMSYFIQIRTSADFIPYIILVTSLMLEMK